MSQTLEQIFIANPSTTVATNDLFYLSLSPYTSGNDSAIKWSDLIAAIISEGAGGTTGELQWNNAGALDGDSITTDGAGNWTGTLGLTGQFNVDNLRLDGNTISSTDAAGNINITPDTTGDLVLDGLNWPQADGSANTVLTTDGAGQLSWTTASFPASAGATGTVLRSDGTNWIASTSTFADTYGASTLLYSNGANTVTGLATANNGILSTNGSGVPAINTTVDLVGQFNIDNLRLDGNTLSSTDTDGDINLTPNGTGQVVITNDAFINNMMLGRGPGNISSNLVFGQGAFASNVDGTASIAMGNSAGAAFTTGSNMVAIGANALENNTGSFNVAIGANALKANTTGQFCTAIGGSALATTLTVSSNTAIGYFSLNAATGSENTGVGGVSGSNISTGGSNTLIGTSTGRSFLGGANLTTGSSNVLIGRVATVSTSGASNCIAIGAGSVANASTGSTSSDAGPGIAIGSSSSKVGFRGDGTIYPTAGSIAGYMVQKINGTEYKVALYDLT
jgi:hypothetical protein